MAAPGSGSVTTRLDTRPRQICDSTESPLISSSNTQHRHVRNISPWDIPELRDYPAQFLDKSQLRTAAAVCKGWNATFTRFLYSNLSWHYRWRQGHPLVEFPSYPSTQLIQKHARNVRGIHIAQYDPFLGQEFPWDTITELRELAITHPIADINILDRMAYLVRRNPGLRKVEYHSRDTDDSLLLVEAFSTCPNLRVLKTYLQYPDLETTIHILNMCNQLSELSICASEVITPDSLSSWPQFPSLTSLSFDNNLNTAFILEVIQRCPRLKKLRWSTYDDLIPIPDLTLVISTKCRELTDLNLMPHGEPDGDSITDEGLANLIDSCTSITGLGVRAAESPVLAMRSLRQHFCRLTRLCVISCPSFSSPIVHELMVSCPMLTQLTARYLDAHDILGAVERVSNTNIYDLNPKDWVCLDLQYFDVDIRGPPLMHGEWQRLIMHQLSRLKKLKVLSIKCIDNRNGDENLSLGRLDLRLVHGSDVLASLKRLEAINFYGLLQQLDVEDVEWMLRAWSNLKHFVGKPNTSAAVCHQLNQVLSKHRVETCYTTYSDYAEFYY
ncbi:hypothetical protein BGX21_002260 [Mortierella sp. AD011]|nr:hypothetical protein BGX20_002125 [Mortierella sp. AD010]KAF9380806.1 hypothetical protein BGX21_002260 [Mortierella sp. AD011]